MSADVVRFYEQTPDSLIDADPNSSPGLQKKQVSGREPNACLYRDHTVPLCCPTERPVRAAEARARRGERLSGKRTHARQSRSRNLCRFVLVNAAHIIWSQAVRALEYAALPASIHRVPPQRLGAEVIDVSRE
jgi:hypothetical protein